MSGLNSFDNPNNLLDSGIVEVQLTPKDKEKLGEKVKKELSPEYLKVNNLLKGAGFVEGTSAYGITEITKVMGEGLYINLYDYDILITVSFSGKTKIEKLVSPEGGKKSLNSFDMNLLISTFNTSSTNRIY